VLGTERPRRTLVVIDDDPAVLGFLCDVLSGAGYVVLPAGDGRSGMDIVESQPVDLVITDLVMPEQEGLETMQRLGALRPDLPVIAISGAFGGSFLKMARHFGAIATLPKPIEPAALLRAVRETLAGHHGGGTVGGSKPPEVQDQRR
jgi:CheY-like chemotaxis protein